MKSKLIASAILASATLAIPTSAMAALFPGQYSLGGIQQICLQGTNAGGTWYGTTFSGWGGQWLKIAQPNAAKYIIFGNYAGGVGNDSIEVRAQSNADWDEWRDDLSFSTFIPNIKITFVKTACDAPARSKSSPTANPSAK